MSTSGFERFPGSWSWPQETEQSSTTTENPTESTKSEDEAPTSPPQQNSPKTRHWRPRSCRICFEMVQPTFHPPPENIPAMLQPQPKVTYESEDGPLLSPCKCKGSQKYVHEQCLQSWRNANPNNRRNYWECPTCGFKYRLSRLGWGKLIVSSSSQIGLTILILFFVVFLLGFIADPIINLYYDPYYTISDGITGARQENYGYEDFEPETWLEHFVKGFASLGLISFLKVFFANPFARFSSSGFATGGRRGGGATGRDRISNVSWLIVIIGVGTFLWSVYKFVRFYSARFLQSAGQRVMDVQGDDDDEEEEKEAAATAQEDTKNPALENDQVDNASGTSVG